MKKTLTLCRRIVRQKLPASGVPTGLPSYISVVHPCINGPYIENEWPTTLAREASYIPMYEMVG